MSATKEVVQKKGPKTGTKPGTKRLVRRGVMEKELQRGTTGAKNHEVHERGNESLQKKTGK